MKKHLEKCPACDAALDITSYTCPECGIHIEGCFAGCTFCKLSDEDRLFALVFLQTEGNMKDVERLMGISYPTVKSKLARLNAALSGESRDAAEPFQQTIEREPTSRLNAEERLRILDRLKSGEITAQEATSLLRGDSSTSDKTKKQGADNV